MYYWKKTIQFFYFYCIYFTIFIDQKFLTNVKINKNKQKYKYAIIGLNLTNYCYNLY